MLYDIEKSIFTKLIGCKIQSLRGQLLYRGGDTIKFKISDVAVNFQQSRLLFRTMADPGFFEDDDGNVFYNYTWNVDDCVCEIADDQIVDFAISSPIKSISVYSRAFKPEEFTLIPNAHERPDEIKEVCDLFLFLLEDGRRVIIVFHPFMPGIEIIFSSHSSDLFLHEYRDLYTLTACVIQTDSENQI